MAPRPDAADLRAGGARDRLERERDRESSGLRPPRRRAVDALGLFAAGLLLARSLTGSPVIGADMWLGVAMALAASGAIMRAAPARAALAIAMLCAGAGWWTLRVAERPHHDLARSLTDTPSLITVIGLVEESPRVSGTQRGALARFARHDQRVARLRISVTAVIDADSEIRSTTGRLYVRVDGPTPREDATSHDDFAAALPRAGRWVRVTGLATRVRAPSNPGEIDFRPAAAARGISGSIRCASAALVQPIDPAPGLANRLRSLREAWIDRLRASSRRLLHDTTGPDATPRSALLGALLLGERDGAYHELSAPFVRLGVSHVLAISGLHIGVFAWVLAMLVRLSGDRWRLETALVLAGVALLLVLIPARAPVVRAGAIIAGFSIAGLFGRRYDALNTLAWVAIGVLVWRPTELLSPGFQLSFGIVAALIALTGPTRDRLFGAKRDPDHRTPWERIKYWTQDALCASLCAWLVSLPIVVHHFGVVTLYAPLLSLVILPLVGVVLVLGYAAVAMAWLWPDAGALLAPPVNAGASAILGLVATLDALPGATMRMPRIETWWTTTGTIVIWLWLSGAYGRVRRRTLESHRARPRMIVVRATAVVAGIVVVGWPVLLVTRGVSIGPPPAAPRSQQPAPANPPPILRWDVIDVGDGSAHIVRTRDGAIMFDCGSSWYGIGERTIPDAARALGAWRIPTVIISHPDGDHYSGLLDCVEPLGIRRVLVGDAFVGEAQRHEASEAHPDEVGVDPRAAFVLAELERKGVDIVEVCAGDTIDLGEGAILEFLSPQPDSTWERDNDASLVALVTANDPATPQAEPVRLLLTGDIEADAMAHVEHALRERSLWGRGIIAMEAPHHGSARDFAYRFVEGVAPRLVIQSTGPSRMGDARWDGVKERLEHWAITARDGAVSAWLWSDERFKTQHWNSR